MQQQAKEPLLNDRLVDFLKVVTEPESVIHVFIKGKSGRFVGYYDREHLENLEKDVMQHSGIATGIYYGLNPVKDSFLDHARNCLRPVSKASSPKNTDIVRRRLMLIDLDPVRPADCSSTDLEKRHAKNLATSLLQDLRKAGWPEPVVVDSGNGYHLLYRVDLPVDDENTVRDVLRALAAKYDCSEVKVDTLVFDAVRIAKLPGTWARKGSSSADRPHRQSGFFRLPPEFKPVPKDLLSALARQAPSGSKKVAARNQIQLEVLVDRLKKHPVAKHIPDARIRTLAELLSRIEKLTESGDGWSGCCPAHADSNPSLSIGVTLDGKILANCYRECEFEDIVQAAGMLMSEMFQTAPSTRSAVLPPRRHRCAVPEATAADPIWSERQAIFLEQVNPVQLQQLANQLGVSVASLEALGVGWCGNNKSWTFPEYNGREQTCGIVRRYSGGKKLAIRSAHRGLTLPKNWKTSDEPLHICEGASDVASAISNGLRAIGRPGLASGFRDLAVLLREEPAEIIVVADNDPRGAGVVGAEKLSKQLSQALMKKIKVMAPPKQFKDLRELFLETNK